MSEKRHSISAGSSDLADSSGSSSPILPTTSFEHHEPPKPAVHPAVYVATWISLSSAVILFNKWVLHKAGFPFPVFLTTWHMLFATVATQVLSRTTKLLDGRKKVRLTGRTYTRAILPIGLSFTLSLICGNMAYLHLSVAFIQMLKACTPVAVLLASWLVGLEKTNMRVLANVSAIVGGVIVASYGEMVFNVTGVIYQVCGLCFEALRLVLIQKLLSSPEYKMDPLVSLYYYAPVCTVMNLIIYLCTEASTLSWLDIQNLGFHILVLNASVAFALNVSVVFLIGRTSSLVLTLCGILKDILLICASVLLYGTTVTLLQVFGYAIALAGLVYYKLGPEQLREHFTVVHSTYREAAAVRKALFAGTAFTTVGIFFVLLRAGAAPYTPSDFPTPLPTALDLAPTLSSTPAPTISPAVMLPLDPLHDVDNLTFTRPLLDHRYTPPRPLDIVISMYREDSTALAESLARISAIPQISSLSEKPRIIIYVKEKFRDLGKIKSVTNADVVALLPNVGRESATYLHHIITRWDDLAAHTLFMQAELHEPLDIEARIKEYFLPTTGMLSLGFGFNTCSCEFCTDPSALGQTWDRIPQIYSAVYHNLCPTDRELLLSFQGQFIVSAKRIRGNPRRLYRHLQELLEADMRHWIHGDERNEEVFEDKETEPFFGHQMERSWMLVFQCNEERLWERCVRLTNRRKEGGKDDDCQCLDE